MKLDIATAPRRDSKQWNQSSIEWTELTAWLDKPDDRKEAGSYLLGELKNGRRRKGTVISRSCLALDADDAQEDLPDKVEMLIPGAAAVHTTFSSTPEHLKYRILIPVDKKLLPDEYRHATNKVMDMLGKEQFDQTCAEPERYMFRPATQDIKTYDRRVFPGGPVSADWLLDDFAVDLSDAKLPKDIGKNKADPLEVPGVVGAFNRAYSIEEAIEAFELPYTPAGSGRWTLVGSASVAGLNLITDHLVYSHHATDPAYGRACSAFDLVRVHKFGDLDEDTSPKAPPHKRPSHDAMLQFAASDERAMREQVEFEFGDDDTEGDDPDAPPTNWKMGLVLAPRTGRVLDEIGNWDLILANDPVFMSLRFNDMSGELEAGEGLPWREVRPDTVTLDDDDRAAMLSHVEREYRLKVPPQRLNQILLGGARFQRHYHPIKEYLATLRWDGTPRVETCLPGVKDTPYTRMVARKVFTAAIARIMQPGCKWDHTLVLYGKENMGKSRWIEKVAKGFSAPLGDTTSKDTLMTMQHNWIMTSDEGHSLKKADADHLKAFLTQTSDSFRRPYASGISQVPRHSVIWSTTNDATFLRRQEGNRRYLIVQCESKPDFAKLTDRYIDQLWAEALHLYESGEKLYLEEEESALASRERDAFTEEEPYSGMVEQYVNTLVPEDWESMSVDARRNFFTNVREGLQKGVKPIDSVCSIQIWTEALGQDQGRHQRTDLLRISAVLRDLPGWTDRGQRRVIHPYGQQVVYDRISSVL